MRLVYVTSSFPYGPGEAFILPEVVELGRQGHEVWVVPMRPSERVVHAEALQLLEKSVVEPLLSWEVLRAAWSEFFRSPARVLRALVLLLTWNPRHLLKNLSVYPKGLWLAGLARRLGADHIHAHWAATTASMAMVASEVSGISWSFTAHRWDIVENNLLARKCQHASFARFISRSGLELARGRGVVCGSRARVLHMGVKLPERIATDKVASAVGRDREFLTVLCAANLIPVKGHTYLIQAIAHLIKEGKKIRLLLAGDGELRPALETQVAHLGLKDWVVFLGYVAHEKLLDLYRQNKVDVFVLPSVDLGNGLHEGIPVSLMEAMAYGVPVIATKTGGIPELLDDGAGLLVPPKDPKALAEAIARLATDPTLRRALGSAGRRRVEQEFAIEVVVRRLVNWFAGSEEKR